MDFKTIQLADLPTPPQSLMAVIRYCSHEQPDTVQLAGLIQIDPLLSAQLLKIANAPYFGFGGNVTSVNRATVLLGISTVRSLALCIALKGLSEKNRIEGFEDGVFWEDAIRRAAISSVLGDFLQLDRDECFTAGLLQDIGLLVLIAQNPDNREFIGRYRGYNPDFRKLLEQDEFGETHDAVAMFLRSHWSLPGSLVDAICQHHDHVGDKPALADILYCTDWLNAMYTHSDRESCCLRCHELLTGRLQLDNSLATEIMQSLPGEIVRLGEALGHSVDTDDFDYAQVLHEAAARVADHNLELQEMTARLKTTIRERDILARELHRDIQVAREVQQALLPDARSGLPVYAFNVPAMDLSGDFYDYIRLPDGRLSFCLGDVSGKGVSSSLLTVKACTLYRMLCGQHDDPGKLAEIMNTELCRITVRGMFITMIIGLYDPREGSIALVNAGHLPALILDQHKLFQTMPSGSPPLGILENCRFSAEKIDIRGKSLYLFSDGITEAHIAENQMLGIEGLVSMLKKIHHLGAAQRMDILLSHFSRTQEKLHDDTTMLLLQG